MSSTPQQKWMHLFSYWRLSLINNEGYGEGLSSVPKRAPVLEKFIQALDPDDYDKFESIIIKYPEVTLYLSDRPGKTELKRFFFDIAVKWRIPRQEIELEVYERSLDHPDPTNTEVYREMCRSLQTIIRGETVQRFVDEEEGVSQRMVLEHIARRRERELQERKDRKEIGRLKVEMGVKRGKS